MKSTSWYIESLILHRLDAWGVGFIIGAIPIILHKIVTPKNLSLLCVLTLGCWLGYIVNDYYDWQNDQNKPGWANLNIFSRHPRIRQYAVPLILGLFTLIALYFLTYKVKGIVVVLVSYFVIWSYSAPTFSLKSRAGFDILIHAVFVQPWPYFLVLYLTNTRLELFDYALIFVHFIGSGSGQLNQQLRDFEIDSKSRNTFVNRIGYQPALKLLKFSSGLTIVLFLLGLFCNIIPLIIAPLGLLALPALLKRVWGDDSPAGFLKFRRIGYITATCAICYTGILLYYT